MPCHLCNHRFDCPNEKETNVANNETCPKCGVAMWFGSRKHEPGGISCHDNQLAAAQQENAELKAEMAECRKILDSELDRDKDPQEPLRLLVTVAVNSLHWARTNETRLAREIAAHKEALDLEVRDHQKHVRERDVALSRAEQAEAGWSEAVGCCKRLEFSVERAEALYAECIRLDSTFAMTEDPARDFDGYFLSWNQYIDQFKGVWEGINALGFNESPAELLTKLVDERDELKSRAERAEAKLAASTKAIDDIRDAVLNERYQLAEMDFGSDRINAVLGIIDDAILSSAPDAAVTPALRPTAVKPGSPEAAELGCQINAICEAGSPIDVNALLREIRGEVETPAQPAATVEPRCGRCGKVLNCGCEPCHDVSDLYAEDLPAEDPPADIKTRDTNTPKRSRNLLAGASIIVHFQCGTSTERLPGEPCRNEKGEIVPDPIIAAAPKYAEGQEVMTKHWGRGMIISADHSACNWWVYEVGVNDNGTARVVRLAETLLSPLPPEPASETVTIRGVDLIAAERQAKMTDADRDKATKQIVEDTGHATD